MASSGRVLRSASNGADSSAQSAPSSPRTPRKGTQTVARTPQRSAPVTPSARGRTTPRTPQSRSAPGTPSRSGAVSPLSQLRSENWSVTESPHQGRSSQAFLLVRDDDNDDGGDDEALFAKRVPIASPDNASDPAYREETILHALARLATAGICFNFVTVVASGLSADARHLDVVMERGGSPLQAAGPLTLAQTREVVFQVLYALAVAQRVYRFVHYDLHNRNVLVDALPAHMHCRIVTRDGRAHTLRHMVVQLADFGLSCLEDAHHVVYNTRNATRGAFDPLHDAAQFGDALRTLVIADRGAGHNAAAMRHFKALRADMRRCAPAALLAHAFFDPLRADQPRPGEVCFRSARDDSADSDATADDADDVRKSPRRKAVK